MATQSIVEGPIHFGDNPASDIFPGMPFVGLQKTFPLELVSIDADDLTLIVRTRASETWGGPGHQVLINNTNIGYLRDTSDQTGPSEIHNLTFTRATLTAALGASAQFQLTITVHDLGGGMDDDFVLDRIEAVGFTTRVPQPGPPQPVSPHHDATQPVAKPAPQSEISIIVVADPGQPPSQRVDNIPWQPGTTVLGAMILADALSPFTFTFRVLFASAYGAMIDMIDGVEEHDGFSWLPYVNGQFSDLGASTILVPGGPGAPNAAIEWRLENVTQGHPAFAHATLKARLKAEWFRG
jgi:hypothetical protein